MRLYYSKSRNQIKNKIDDPWGHTQTCGYPAGGDAALGFQGSRSILGENKKLAVVKMKRFAVVKMKRFAVSCSFRTTIVE